MREPIRDEPKAGIRPSIWREWELAVPVLLVVAFYLLPLTWLSVRGEEPRRAQVAREMIATGDWIVPRVQEQLFISRPPFQNWLIALGSFFTGGVDVLAVRFPTVAALLATALLIYWYARHFMARLGAMSATVAFLTMFQVLELGRLGETEILFTFLLTASLVIWHVHAQRGRLTLSSWIVPYTLIALGVLTKGLQAPAYFGIAVAAFLLVKGRWRELASWRHAAGIAAGVIVWGAWQGAYFASEGWHATRQMYWHDVALRFEDQGFLTFAEHFVVYPAEVMSCMLPWSPLLAAYLYPSFRRGLGGARSFVLFMALALILAFPSCWLVPGAKSRYFVPLYPCVAILAGLVIERTATAAGAERWIRPWSRLCVAAAAVMVATGPALFVASWTVDPRRWGQPSWLSGLLLVVSAGLGLATYASRRAGSGSGVRRGVLALAIYLGVAYCGVFLYRLVVLTPPTAAQVAEVKRSLPDDARLVSYGPVDPVFLFHFDDRIEVRPADLASVHTDDARIFCLSSTWGSPDPGALDFPWEQIATVNCDRAISDEPERVVVVGRRLARSTTRPPPPGGADDRGAGSE